MITPVTPDQDTSTRSCYELYGVRRIHAELRRFGHTVNRKRAERLMRINRVDGRHLRRRKRTTVPDRLAPPAPRPTCLRCRPVE
ncbi:IS3 family transposase [Streptomyces sp. NPDC088560]|uniref:IS3 family transposase n=1 Tax=Streptomyces sp. NPDC088560 TaxID=3365868 RepID=UPI00382F6D35